MVSSRASDSERERAADRLGRLHAALCHSPTPRYGVPVKDIDIAKVQHLLRTGEHVWKLANCSALVVALVATPMWAGRPYLLEGLTVGLGGPLPRYSNIPKGLVALSHQLGAEGRVMAGDLGLGILADHYLAAGWRHAGGAFIHS